MNRLVREEDSIWLGSVSMVAGRPFPSRRLRARPNVLAGARQGVPLRNPYIMTMVPAIEDKGNWKIARIGRNSRIFSSILCLSARNRSHRTTQTVPGRHAC